MTKQTKQNTKRRKQREDRHQVIMLVIKRTVKTKSMSCKKREKTLTHYLCFHQCWKCDENNIKQIAIS